MIFQCLTAAGNEECSLPSTPTEGTDLTGGFAASHSKSFEVWPQHVINMQADFDVIFSTVFCHSRWLHCRSLALYRVSTHVYSSPRISR